MHAFANTFYACVWYVFMSPGGGNVRRREVVPPGDGEVPPGVGILPRRAFRASELPMPLQGVSFSQFLSP